MSGDPPSAAPRLALAGVTKRFGPVEAVAPVDLVLPPASIHGLLGENGAGKSTLVRMVAGALRQDAGTIRIDGVALPPGKPSGARAAGVGVVHQHFALVPALSVAENLLLGRPEAAGGFLAPARLADDARRLAETHGLDVGDPRRPCRDLPVGTQARVEILRALSAEPHVLLLDEPTAVLTPAETDDLFVTLRRLRDRGMLIVLVTHKLPEALAVCDAVTVMRSGQVQATAPARGLSTRELARLMVGDAETGRSTAPAAPAAVGPNVGAALRVEGVTTPAGPDRVALAAVTLTVGLGEIVGIAGVDGNGQTELAHALAGLAPRAGRVTVGGVPVPAGDVGAAQAAGLALVPGDRRREGLVSSFPVWENALLAAPLVARLTRHGLLDHAAARAAARTLVDEYRVVLRSVDDPVATLSGGNQQRIVVGRALALRPRALVAVNPTRGLDVAATAHVHATLRAAAGRGVGVLLISTDLDELAAVADRAFVLYRGRLAGPVSPRDRERLGALMAGVAA